MKNGVKIFIAVEFFGFVIMVLIPSIVILIINWNNSKCKAALRSFLMVESFILLPLFKLVYGVALLVGNKKVLKIGILGLECLFLVAWTGYGIFLVGYENICTDMSFKSGFFLYLIVSSTLIYNIVNIIVLVGFVMFQVGLKIGMEMFKKSYELKKKVIQDKYKIDLKDSDSELDIEDEEDDIIYNGTYPIDDIVSIPQYDGNTELDLLHNRESIGELSNVFQVIERSSSKKDD